VLYKQQNIHISTEKEASRQQPNIKHKSHYRFVRKDKRSLVGVMSLSAVCAGAHTRLSLFFSLYPSPFFCIDESQSFDFVYVARVAAAVLSKKMLLYKLFCGFIIDVF